MKRFIYLIITVLLMVSGCSSKNETIPRTNTVQISFGGTEIKMAYNKPLDFKQFEVYISKTTLFNPTGWNGTIWNGEPNVTAEWDGADNNLFMVTAAEPINVTGLTAGTTYYVKVVAVDKSNQRSTPSAEYSPATGDTQRGSALVVAASNASPASKAGADYVCDGTNDEIEINNAISELTGGGEVKLTEGTFLPNASIILNDNIHFAGSGNTVIKWPDGRDGFTNIISAEGTESVNKQNIQIKNLTIDGNKANQDFGSQGGINLIYLTNAIVENVIVYNLYGGNGIFVSTSNNITVNKSTAFGCGTAGIDIVYSTNCNVEGNITYNNLRGIEGNNCQYVNFLNNTSYQNIGNGIYLYQSSHCSINANTVKENEQTNPGGGDPSANILIAESSYNNIQNNLVRRGTLTDKATSGICILDTASTVNLVSNNDCYQGGITYGIRNFAGSTTNFGSGNRLNTGNWATGQG